MIISGGMRPGDGSRSRSVRVGVDVGGTFTDLVAVRDGKLITVKVASRPGDESAGVVGAVDASELESESIAAIAHGTTVATNALLERRGARTALVTTEGFRDVIEIGRQDRPSLYDLAERPPNPLVPRELRFTVTERIGPRGIEIELDEDSVRRAATSVAEADVDAVAVCLLFSFVDPSHERRVRDIVREVLPHVRCSLSSDVLPEFREYERFSTTTADAYLRPALAVYLELLGTRLRERGLPEPVVMQSSGGVVDLATAVERPSACVLSGPAAGVVAAAFVAADSGYVDLLTFDMGGTSTDVSLVLGGELQTTTSSVVGGIPIKHPMVDVHTVSAGGGSIAWVDTGGALRVGPRSAGARPGPACYGLGGEQVTVTDANLYLGYLGDGATLGGEVVLHRGNAESAMERLASELGIEPVAAANGVITVAEAEMARALRVVSVERGVDPRGLTLVAFGGAGGLHACRLAEGLGIARVHVPRAAGVLSALGLAVSDLRRDYVAPFFAEAASLTQSELDGAFAGLEQQGGRDLDAPVLRRFADARYKGQSFELTVDAEDGDAISSAFRVEHEQRYGYSFDDASVELVAIRLLAHTSATKPRLGNRSSGTLADGRPQSARTASFDGHWIETRMLAVDALGRGERVTGPAIVDLGEATCLVRPGWVAATDESGALTIERC
jgi:N-methylhydantoinase A